MTAIGPIHLSRHHAYCQKCKSPQFAADRVIGLDGWLTVRARQMADLAGINDPFRKAERLLAELAGWSADAETLRLAFHKDARAARNHRCERVALPDQFASASGDRELQLDAGKVNTPDGFRDIKVAVFACRVRGKVSTSSDCEKRKLPAPSVRSVIAEVEQSKEFGPRCATEAKRLGVSAKGLSVLGDGAEWIWNQAHQQFLGATQVLDVFHGSEELAKLGRAAQGEAGLSEWLAGARQKMVADGYMGVCEVIVELTADEEKCKRMGETTAQVLNYFTGQQTRLGYAVRLLRGQSIGSGLVEGTIKQRINIRMKRTGARWLPEHIGPFVEMHAMADSTEWAEFWAFMAM
jgi:hypothetical protein